MKKIAFLIPMNNIVIAPMVCNFFEVIINLSKEGYDLYLISTNDTFLNEARNKMAKEIAIKHNAGLEFDVDYVIWIDSDQCEFDSNTIKRLIESFEHSTHDIISVAYFHRSYPPASNPQLVGLVANEIGTYDYIKDYKFGEVIPVDVVGMGMCIMRPEILSKLYNDHKVKLFMPTISPDGRMFGEDIVFCKYAKEAGYTMAIDTNITIGHGLYTIDKNIVEALRVWKHGKEKIYSASTDGR
jgi:hypothetical protein